MNIGKIFGLVRQFTHFESKKGSPISAQEVQRAEWKFYIDYLQEGMVVLDVGANIGEETLLFSKFIGQGGQVHAFEPSSATFRHLERICESAIRYRGRTNITLNQMAVTERECEMYLHIFDDRHSGLNTFSKRPLKDRGVEIDVIGKEKVYSTTIDHYCERNDIENVDLLKIDVEGSEYQVLLGARHMLESKSIQCLVFEFGKTWFDMGNDPGDAQIFIEEMGYDIHNVVAGEPVVLDGSSIGDVHFSMYYACIS